jgi:hypothetical protein
MALRPTTIHAPGRPSTNVTSETPPSVEQAQYLSAMQTFDRAIAAADAAAGTVFSPNNGNLDDYSQPPVPYAVGDTWHTTDGIVYICTTANASAFDQADWSNFTFFAEYIAAGTLLTSPVIVQTAPNGGSQLRMENGQLSFGDSYLRKRFLEGVGNVDVMLYPGPNGQALICGWRPSIPGPALPIYSPFDCGDLTAHGTVTAAALALDPPTTHYVGAVDEPTFQNSWANYGGTTYGSARFYKDSQGLVHLSGLIKNGVSAAAAFTLPEGYRPGRTQLCPTLSASNVLCRIDIGADGVVKPTLLGSGTNVFVSLFVPPFLAEG